MASVTGPQPVAARHVAVELAGRLVAWLNWEPARRAEPDISWSTPLTQQGWLCPSQAQLSWVGPKNPNPAGAHRTEVEAEPPLLWLAPRPKWGQSWWLGAGHLGGDNLGWGINGWKTSAGGHQHLGEPMLGPTGEITAKVLGQKGKPKGAQHPTSGVLTNSPGSLQQGPDGF